MRNFWLMTLLALMLAGCAETPSEPESAAPAPASEPAAPEPEGSDEQLVGGDADEYGCIGSAGYQWCEATGQCERPWELADRASIENSAEAFEAFCAGEPELIGGDRDENGCIGSAGYVWCESTAQCERPWELAASAGFEDTAEGFTEHCTGAQPVGADRDENGCIGSAGYSWCESTGQCERPFELAQEAGFELTAEAFAAHCTPEDGEG